MVKKNQLDINRYCHRIPEERRLTEVLKKPASKMSNTALKHFAVFENNETKKMGTADLESRSIENGYRLTNLRSSPSNRPAPKFLMGQSVHHFWAGWFDGQDTPRPTIKGKGRPAWYSGEIVGPAKWETIPYAGQTIEGWTYIAF